MYKPVPLLSTNTNITHSEICHQKRCQWGHQSRRLSSALPHPFKMAFVAPHPQPLATSWWLRSPPLLALSSAVALPLSSSSTVEDVSLPPLPPSVVSPPLPSPPPSVVAPFCQQGLRNQPPLHLALSLPCKRSSTPAGDKVPGIVAAGATSGAEGGPYHPARALEHTHARRIASL